MGLLYLIDLIKDYNNKYIYERVYKKPHLIPIRRTVPQINDIYFIYLDFNEARGTVVRFIFYTNQSTVPKEYMTQ